MSCAGEPNPAAAAATVTPPSASIPRIGDPAPDFTAMTTKGELTFSSWQEGKWVMLFSHPADFTPVCTTELAEFARRGEDFTRRNVKLIGISVDSIHSHQAWRQSIQDIFDVRVDFPMVADSNAAVAQRYGMIHPGASATATVRAVFMIDPKRVIRALVYYPLNVGRSVDELLRLLDALQTADKHSVSCPVNWKPGDKVIVPPPKTDDEVEQRKAASNLEGKAFYLKQKSL